MNECDLFRYFRRHILLFALLLSGCATPMQMSSEDLSRLTPTEGIIVGSVQIKGGDDILGRKQWTLFAERIKDPLSSLVSPGLEYSLQAFRGEAEEVFVTKMAAGDYRFSKLFQPGFSTFTATTNVYFRVQAGKTVYVGRLVVEFPPGLLSLGTTFRTVVEDARALTLDGARRKYGLSSDDVITDLMKVRN
jgi:hypothetical protein